MTTATDLYLQALAGETVYHPEVWALVPSSCPHDNPDLELAGQIVGERSPPKVPLGRRASVCLDDDPEPDTIAAEAACVQWMQEHPESVPPLVCQWCRCHDWATLARLWIATPDHQLWSTISRDWWDLLEPEIYDTGDLDVICRLIRDSPQVNSGQQRVRRTIPPPDWRTLPWARYRRVREALGEDPIQTCPPGSPWSEEGGDWPTAWPEGTLESWETVCQWTSQIDICWVTRHRAHLPVICRLLRAGRLTWTARHHSYLTPTVYAELAASELPALVADWDRRVHQDLASIRAAGLKKKGRRAIWEHGMSWMPAHPSATYWQAITRPEADLDSLHGDLWPQAGGLGGYRHLLLYGEYQVRGSDHLFTACDRQVEVKHALGRAPTRIILQVPEWHMVIEDVHGWVIETVLALRKRWAVMVPRRLESTQ